MSQRISYVYLLILLISCALQAQAQIPLPEQVCVGTVHHYWVEGLPGSTYTWRVNGVIQSSISDNIDIQWNEIGEFTLEVQEHQLTCDGDVQTGLVTVTDQIIPEFTALNTYCAGSMITALPTVSNNGITGTWSPAINNSLTTEYIFTPDDDQCAIPTTLTITITDQITPTFAPIAAVCNGSTINLPEASLEGITGTWSPAINNSATTTYTFTPDATYQCATTAELTITISDEVTPTFAQIGPYCAGEEIAALPTISINGITGTWSPAINNSLTTEYTFTPDAGQCGTTTTMIIAISDEITPTFTQVGPFCAGSTINALPTTSENGITGIWSPAINNTQTTEYIFTPDDDQCAIPTTLTITITDQIIPTFAPIAAVCNGSTINLPGVSLEGITGSWSPAINNTETTTYTFTPDVNNPCATTATLTITISDEIIPTFAQVGPYCAGFAIEELPTTSNNGITGSWSPAINNTQTTEYTFTPDAGQCGTTATMTIVISDEIIPTFASVGPYCAGSAIADLPTTSTNGITGTWSPAINNNQTTEYTFTPDAGQCGTTTTMTIVINEEIIPVFDPVGPYNSGSLIADLPTTSNNGITGTWSPAIDNTRTTDYTFTPDANQCAVSTTLTIAINDEIIPLFDPIGPLCSGADINLPTTSINGITGTWSPAINNTQNTTYTFTPDAGQGAVTATLTIEISNAITPVFDPIGPLCSGATYSLPATSTNNITGSWSPAIDNTQTTTYVFTPDAGQCGISTTLTVIISEEITPLFAAVGPYCAGFAIPELPTTSTNGITGSWSPVINNTQTTEYTFTPDAGQCGTTTTMTITISDEITPTFAQVGPYCAGSTIADLPTTSTNGITGSWSPAINNTQTTEYTFTPDAGQCGITTTLTIVINEEVIPVFDPVGPYNSGSIIAALPTTSNNGITGSWSPDINNTQTTTYTFTPDANQCAVQTTLTIEIQGEIIPLFDPIGPLCSGADINLPTTSTNGITGTWSPAINNTQTTTYTFTPDAGQGAVSASLTIEISNAITPVFDPVGPLCIGTGFSLPSTSNNGITGSWSPAINNTQTTTYTFTPDAGQCGSPVSLTVTISEEIIPVFAAVGPYCAGFAIANLPTTSNNGITGSWSPAINNIQTTEYTFTPNEGQCGVSTTLTIEITDEIIPAFDPIGPLCAGSAIILPVVSNNGISGTWAPAIDNTQTTEYTFTPDGGQCGIPTTLTVTISNEIVPTFEVVDTYCAGASITALPTTSTNGITGSWSPAINNTQTTEYTFTPDPGQCGTITTLTITISNEIIPTFEAVGPSCAGASIAALPTTSTNGITGSWSPAIDNSRTTTYTFTPDPGQCAVPATLTIEITNGIIPVFDPAGSYCPGDAIAELPSESNNGISGYWSPSINNQLTTTYTFTPDEGQCAVPTTLTITITPGVVPVFDPVGPYCPGDVIVALPSESNNGISGTWSPAIDNTRTTTYTFTPDEGQCAVNITLTIVIEQGTVPTFDPVGNYCSGAVIADLPTTSNNGITGFWSPAIDNSRTTTYTFTPHEGQCATTASLTIIIDQSNLPTFEAVGPYCPGSDVPELPTVSTNSISGTWSPAIDNTRTTTYTFTPDEGQCATVATLTIVMEGTILPEFDPIAVICSGEEVTLPSESNNGISGTWTPAINNTQTTTYTFTPDAGQCGVSTTLTVEVDRSIFPEFDAAGSYCPGDAIAELPTVSNNGIRGSWSPGINNQQTTTYTFTPDGGQCASSTTLTIIINQGIIPTFDPVGPYCQGDAIGDLPTVSNNGISGSWSPAIDNTQSGTYTFTPDEGQCASTTLLSIVVEQSITPLFEAVGPYCPGADIPALPTVSNNGISGSWSPAIDNTQTTTYTFRADEGQCLATATLTIVIDQDIMPIFHPVGPFCPGTEIAALPTVSINGISGSWSPAIDNTQTTNYTFTPDEGQCGSPADLTIEITDQINPTFDAMAPVCIGAPIVLPLVSREGITGTWSPGVDNTQTTTYTFTPEGGACGTTATLTVEVLDNTTPDFSSVGPFCPGADIADLPRVSNNNISGSWSPAINNMVTTTYTFVPDDGQCAEITNLTIEIQESITPTFEPAGTYCRGASIASLPTVSIEGINGSWTPDINNQQSTTYTFTPDGGQCATVATLTILITDQLIPEFDAAGIYCPGTDIPALPTVSNNGINGSWSPALNNQQTTTYTFTPDEGQCATIASLTIVVDANIVPEFDALAPICSGGTIQLPDVSNNGISGTWSPAINNTQTTTYTFTPDEGQCATIASLTVEVEQSIIPTFDPVGPYCPGAAIADLPNVSNNGISGSWSPEIDNTRTTTYTFTPDDGQCVVTASLTILIEQSPAPVFDPVSTYCPGAEIPALPTVSNNGIRGSWSPEIDNTRTTTYTFIPDEDQCATTATLTIFIDQSILPTFDAVGPFCPGADIPALPTVSNNGISGSWSPEINNQLTTTYTFTPDAGQCGSVATLTINVEQGILPVFASVGPYCLGDDIPALPTVSNNGINGSWSPAINNQQTTTYTFTPDAGQCGSPTTLTVFINQPVIPTFASVGPYCAGAAIPALPIVSNNGIWGLWSPEINNQLTTTYTFTPDAGQCGQVTTLTIDINDEITPVFTQMGPYCAGAAIPALPVISNNGIRGSWSPALDNTQTTTYTFTPNSGQCGVTVTMTIEISDEITPLFDPVGPYCLGAAIAALPTVSNNGIRGSWSPAVNNQQTTTYTFTPNSGQCCVPTTLTVEISDQITPVFDPIGPFCHGATIAPLPTVSNNGISGSWSPAINNTQTTTYTFTPDAGQCGSVTTLTVVISDEIIPVFTAVGPYCAGAVIEALPTTSNNGITGSWSPAINNQQTTTYTFTPDAGQCAVGTSLTITISDEVIPTFNQPAAYCLGSAIAALPAISNNGIRGTWSPAINNQQTTTYTFTPNAGQCGTTASLTIEISDETIPAFDPAGPYTLGSEIPALPVISNNSIRGSWSPGINNQQTTTYTFTPNAGQCAGTTSLTIEITDQVVPTFDPVGPYCAGSDIAALPTVSNNGISGSWSPAINNQQTTTYTFTPDAGQSAGIARLTITINDEVRPTFDPVDPYCAGTVIADLPTVSTNGISGSWSPAINNRQTTTYTFTPDQGQCAASATLNIEISDGITPTFALVDSYCSGSPIEALPATSINGIHGSWSPAINNIRTTIYTFTPDAGQCASVATLTITIDRVITPSFDPIGPFCRGSVIAALPTVSNNDIQGTWSPAINSSQTTTYTFTPTTGQCAIPVTMTIEVTDEILPTFDPAGPFCPGAVIAELPAVSNNGIRGTWSPVINNHRTTTYTFTPDAGQCGISTTTTIIIEENATPTFDPVGPYCVGSAIADLPTVSNNGITGNWRPAINNHQTTTYTFTPDAGQCGVATTLTIAVTDEIIPTFDPVGPYCPGSAIAELPAVSNNGITGTWSPAINNTRSTNYTFTPDEGQCATTATLRIVIDQRTVPTFDPVASYCMGSAIGALRTVSNNGVRGTWRPAINNTRTTTYTFTPDAGQCSEPVAMTIEISDEVDPTFDPVGPYPRGAAIAALRNVSNNGIRGTWRPALNNRQTTTYTFTPDAGQCSRPVRMTIAITDDIIPVFDPVGAFCPGTAIADLPTVSNNGIRGTWSPAINNQQTTTYTFTPEDGQSAAIVTMTITISEEILPEFNPMGPYCPGSVIADLPTVSNNGIRGTWSPAINNQQTTTYTFTPEGGQCAIVTSMTIVISEEIHPEFNPMGPYCPGSVIADLPTVSSNGIRGTWSPEINNEATTVYTFTPDAGQCALTTTLSIEIGTDIVPEFDLIGPFCPGTPLESLPVVSKNGIIGRWSPVMNNMVTTNYLFTPLEGQCATETSLTCEIGSEITPLFTQVGPFCTGSTIPALPTTSTNGVAGTWSPAINNTQTTTYTFTPEIGRCALPTVMTITILEETVPTFNPVDSYCEGAAMAALPTISLNGISGSWSPALNNRQTTTYTFTPEAGQCAVTASLTVVIVEGITPEFEAVGPFCEGTVIAPLPTVSINGIRGRWSPAINNSVTTTYTFTPEAGQCAAPVNLTIEIEEGIVPVFAPSDIYCTGSAIAALPNTSINNITGTWSPAINNRQTTTYTFTPDAGQCARTTELTILINPEPATPVARVIQPDCTILTGTVELVSPRGTQYHYRLDGGNYQASALFSGLSPQSRHTIQVRDILTGCESQITTVTINSLPQPPHVPVAVVVANPRCDGGGVIEVTDPTGSDYEYSMDGGAYQSMVAFGNVTWGEHLITVRNKTNGCVSAAARVFLPDIPEDMDFDGIADALDSDVDGDGILNSYEAGTIADFDEDGHMNYMDIDADGDGIVDNLEAQDTEQYILPAYADEDNDGLDDAYDNDQGGAAILPADSDRDGNPDFLDLDTDNDLVPDYIEGHDEDSNGKPDHFALNGDGDKDGLDDGYDIVVNDCGSMENALGSNAPTQDFDGDGKPDWRDDNDDDDQYLTKFEDLNADGDFSNDDIDFDGYPEYLDYGRECDLFIPDAFSPNGDNVHDFYQIYCINHYPDATIYIFDQLGNKIYEKAHYGNLEFWKTPAMAWWDGKPTRGPGYSRDNLVPPGTYYYVLDLGNGEVKKSYVFVSY